MKKSLHALINPVRHFCCCAALLIVLALLLFGISPARGQAQPQTNPPERDPAPASVQKEHPVTSGDSVMVRNARVYSIQFPGGTAGQFFEFLQTNGFAKDNVLFAGEAARIHVPPFAVRHVRLADVAKALELVTESKLSVEVVEKGEFSDENIWRVKASPQTSIITTRTCAMPNFFRRSDAIARFQPIVNAAEGALQKGLLDVIGTEKTQGGHTYMLAPEKIVIVIGPPAYVETVSSALEAAEKVAAADAEAVRNR